MPIHDSEFYGHQRGGGFRLRTYLLIALLALSIGEALLIRNLYHRLQPQPLPLWEAELYQLTPEEWNDESYQVTIVPSDGYDVCDAFGATCTIRI